MGTSAGFFVGEESKQFFFGKKNQKTFAHKTLAVPRRVLNPNHGHL
jgi:hypothetical protein